MVCKSAVCTGADPIYIMISVVLPLGALIAGRGIGMRYRKS